jgi:hypothetical protein
MFYVARTYLSLGTLKALGVVEEEFPRVPTLLEVAASNTTKPVLPT